MERLVATTLLFIQFFTSYDIFRLFSTSFSFSFRISLYFVRWSSSAFLALRYVNEYKFTNGTRWSFLRTISYDIDDRSFSLHLLPSSSQDYGTTVRFADVDDKNRGRTTTQRKRKKKKKKKEREQENKTKQKICILKMLREVIRGGRRKKVTFALSFRIADFSDWCLRSSPLFWNGSICSRNFFESSKSFRILE